MNSYEVRFNKSKFAFETLEEAEAQARELIQANQPFEARIIEVDEDGKLVRTVKTLGPQHA
jgi:Ser-tRNA(Ala) deacylase AlaX